MGVLAPIGMAIMPALAGSAGAAATSASAAAATSIGASAVGTGLQMGGSLLQGISGFQQGMFQSKLAGYNAQLALGQKAATLRAGDIAAQQQLMKTGKEVGAAVASQGASGVDVGGGSAKTVQKAIQTSGQFDAATLRYNAATKAYGLQQEYASDMMQKQASKLGAIGSLVGGVLGMGTSFLGGAASASDKWLQFSAAGINVPQAGPTVIGTQANGDPIFAQ